MSLARPILSALIARSRADIDGRLPGADSRLSRSLLDVLARVHSGALDGGYGYLSSIALDVMPDTADADHLERWAAIWGVVRKPATIAAGPVAFAGIDGAIVPAGTVLLRADGTRYTVDAAVMLAGGAGLAVVTAASPGVAGNADAGVALAFASPAVGVGASATIGAGADAGGLDGGSEEETDGSLRARLLTRIQTPPKGGSASDYEDWALDQSEVTRAWVYPGWVGAGSVGVAVVMDARPVIFPTDDDCAAIQAALEPLRPVTAALVVFAPTPYPTPFALRVTPSTAVTKAAVLAELADLYAREAAPGGTMLVSHVREAIAVAAGVTDYALAVPAGDIVAPPGRMPTIGDLAWL